MTVCYLPFDCVVHRYVSGLTCDPDPVTTRIGLSRWMGTLLPLRITTTSAISAHRTPLSPTSERTLDSYCHHFLLTTLLSAGSIARLRQRPEKLGPKLRVSAQYFIICVDYNKLDRKGYRTRHQFRSRNRLSVNADIAYGHGYACLNYVPTRCINFCV